MQTVTLNPEKRETIAKIVVWYYQYQRVWALSLCFGYFLYDFYFRSVGIAQNFLWLGDQIRDWTIAQRGLFSMPSHGTMRSTDGQYSYGPIYYWLLYLIRVTVGPFFNHLPHAGGLGIAFFHALADTALVYSLMARNIFKPLVLAFGLVLMSSPLEGAISGTIWNPPVAVSFIHLGLALVILPRLRFQIKNLIFVTLCAIFAVHAHTQAIFSSAGILLAAVFLWHQSGNFDLKTGLKTLGILTVASHVPYILHVLNHGYSSSTSTISDGVKQLFLEHSIPNLRATSLFIQHSISTQLIPELDGFPIFWIWIPTAAYLLFRPLKAGIFCLIGIGPMILVTFGFALVKVALNDYWFITLYASFLLIFLVVIEDLHRRFAFFPYKSLSLALLGLTLLIQPKHIAMRQTLGILPDYKIMVDAVTQIKNDAIPVSKISDASRDTISCASCLYEFIGGKLDPKSETQATLSKEGQVTFVTQRP